MSAKFFQYIVSLYYVYSLLSLRKWQFLAPCFQRDHFSSNSLYYTLQKDEDTPSQLQRTLPSSLLPHHLELQERMMTGPQTSGWLLTLITFRTSVMPHTFINLIRHWNIKPLKSFIYLAHDPIVPWPLKLFYWSPGLVPHNLNLLSEVPLTFYNRILF